ncbi:MAG: VWA domain-containing protein [Phototrophicaceae bacterium]
MDQRMVEFIRALRAAGVRISISESQDAMFGVNEVGIINLEHFKNTMKATLVKEHRDQDKFDYFFPLFFNSNQPPMQDIMDNLTPEQQEMLQQALESLMGDMDALRDMLQQLMNGQGLTQEQLDQMGEMSGLPNGDEMYQRAWFERRMQRQAQMNSLERMIGELLDELAEMGMSDEALAELEQMLRDNLQGISDQISQYVGASLAEQMAQREPDKKPDLLDVPFTRLSQNDIDNIRDEIRRLAAKLRSRASMRQRKKKSGQFDPRKTIRQNMKYGGVPIEIKFRKKHKKPKLVLICDLSTSMRYMVEFLMTLVYEMSDHVQKTSSYIFISDMVDVSMDLEQMDSQDAVAKVLKENPPGHYSTDLGNSFATFEKEHYSVIDSRTTVIILGDGRNNYNDPRLDIHGDMQRKARRLFWFCPEPQGQWGTGDSDMHKYAAQADGVYRIRNLRDLASAVDSIIADGSA